MGGAIFRFLRPVTACQRRTGRHACFGLGKRGVRGNQHCTLFEVARIDQPGDRDFDEIGIARIQLAISVGEPLAFDEQVPELRIVRAKRGQIKAFQLREHLRHRDPARRRRPHPAYPVNTVWGAYGRAFFRLIGGDIGRRHAPVLRGFARHVIGERGGGAVTIHRLWPGLGERLQRIGQRRHTHRRANRQRFAIGTEKHRACGSGLIRPAPVRS